MNRRVVQVRVHSSVFEEMLFPSRPGVWTRTDFGLPVGAKCINRGYDWERDCFYFIFEHESFAEVPQGEFAPEFRDFQMHAFCFESPVDEKQVKQIDKLTREQIFRALDGIDPNERMEFNKAEPTILLRKEGET